MGTGKGHLSARLYTGLRETADAGKRYRFEKDGDYNNWQIQVNKFRESIGLPPDDLSKYRKFGGKK